MLLVPTIGEMNDESLHSQVHDSGIEVHAIATTDVEGWLDTTAVSGLQINHHLGQLRLLLTH